MPSNGAAKSTGNVVCLLIQEHIQLLTYKQKTVALTNSSRREGEILVSFNTQCITQSIIISLNT